MSHPFERFLIALPPEVEPATMTSLMQSVMQTQGVKGCDDSTTRSLDLPTLMLGVQLVGAAITTVGAAVVVVKQIVDLCKSKGIKGAKLLLANGSVLEVDSINIEDLLRFTEQK